MNWKARGVALAAAMALAAPAHAQDSGRGFLFGRPDWNLSLRGGFAHPNVGSDVFSEATSRLTLNRSDFNGATFGADLGYSLAPNIDLSVGVSYAGTSKRSEFRNYLDNKNLPIEQTTNFARVPLTASLKWFLTPRGRSLGRFAWVPSRYALFLGAGGGAMWYNFEQNGDFVNFQNNNIEPRVLKSSSWTPTAHVLAGFDYSLSPHWSLTTEGRYTWAKTDLGRDFTGFQPIDLSGFTTTVGLSLRF